MCHEQWLTQDVCVLASVHGGASCKANVESCCHLQTEEEQREQQAVKAGMQRLPAGIQQQRAQQPAGVCHVCYVEDYSDDNLLLEVHPPVCLACK